MGLEIERKWLLCEIPYFIEEKLDTFECIEMIQGYLCREPVIRVRKENAQYVLTYKGKGLKIREEYNLPLNQTAFEELLPKCTGKIISKKRYRIPLEQGLCAELDIFKDDLAPLVLLEVEFPDERAADAFIPEKWFGKEVTGQEKYTNSALSL